MDKAAYYAQMSQAREADEQATQALKKLSQERPRDPEHLYMVTRKADRELVRRTKRTMLYLNKSYMKAARIVADLDPILMQLYVWGEIVKE